jgi:hypothetical protein
MIAAHASCVSGRFIARPSFNDERAAVFLANRAVETLV